MATQLTGSNLCLPPRFDELEVSIFGPGYGECLVVHLGHGEWLIVDSCVSAETGRPEALEYFSTLGLDPSRCIKLVVATHWHDDHVRGLSEVFEAAPNARFWCSAALRSSEWLTLVKLQNKSYFLPGGSGVSTMGAIMKLLEKRSSEKKIVSPEFAIQGLPIYSRSNGPEVKVTAYSPSSAAVLAMHREFATQIEGFKVKRGRIPTMGKNDGSVVLSVEVGNGRVLLGADLEELGIEGLGWTAVLSHLGDTPPKHQGFKVSHHGSPTGHHDNLWPSLLTNDAWAVVTPWKKGAGFLPSKEDIDRILRLCPNHAYITAPPKGMKYRHPDKSVQRTLQEMGADLHLSLGRQGHVRMRRSNEVNSDWKIDLFGSASSLSHLIQDERRVAG